MLKKIVIILGIILVLIYILFLALPFFTSGLINSYTKDIEKLIEDSSGFKANIEKIQLITTPKLTIGGRISNVNIILPNGDKIVSAENAYIKVALIPLCAKKIRIDSIGADNLNINLTVKKDGKFLIEDYMIKNTSTQSQSSLPAGLKLSNSMPDVKINNYNISFKDYLNNIYSIYGYKAYITDFIFNKKIKITLDGKFKLKDREQITCDLKLFNKIMPTQDINELLSAPQAETNQPASFNVIDIFKAVYNNQLTSNIKADIKTSGTPDKIDMSGSLNISNMTLSVDGKKLPPGMLDLFLTGNKIKINTELYTSDSEKTTVNGELQAGKTPKINLNFKSNTQFQSLINLADSVAKTFGYKELDTLSATGKINADFNLKSDFKTVTSEGYLKIPDASLSYKLYNAYIDKIFADIQLDNNIIKITDAGLTIIGQPLKIKGSISDNIDINIIADRLRVKELLIALGQAALLKENSINNGTLTVNASIKGKLDKILPKVNVSLDNLNIKNIPTNISVSVPKANLDVGEKDILIENSYMLFMNSKIDLSGKITDYISEKIHFDINAAGKILASDIRALMPAEFKSEVKGAGALPLRVDIAGNMKSQDIKFNLSSTPANYASIISVDELKGKTTEIKGAIKILGDTLNFVDTGIFANGIQIGYLKGSVNDIYNKQKFNLNVSTLKNVSVVVPYFPKSKMNLAGNIDISGNMLYPILKGRVSVPTVKIPEMLLDMENLEIVLNGAPVNGNGTLKRFVSGGIVAENLSSDFNLINNMFYLKNLSGDSFGGKINGNISYNLANGHIGAELKGSKMNAIKAIEGAAGIKNALSGTLDFNANVTTHGANDIDMMKNLKGNADFGIINGEFGNIGRFENLILAQNILANPIMKAAVNSVQSLPTVKSAAQFKYIKGNMNFSNGWAYLNPVTTAGPSMAYYIAGKYNLLNGSANIVILGRISAEIVKLLGPVGELSVTKLTSYIPKFGTATGKIINAMTSNPALEKTTLIPQLSENKSYKDFKVEFNGGIESKSSVKSFKWLSKCDTSELESLTLKEQVQKTKTAVQEAKQEQIDKYNKYMEEQRKQAKEAKQEVQNAVNTLKNFKNLLNTKPKNEE